MGKRSSSSTLWRTTVQLLIDALRFGSLGLGNTLIDGIVPIDVRVGSVAAYDSVGHYGVF